MKKAISISLTVLLVLSSVLHARSPESTSPDTISIASFNIQVLGRSKVGKPEVMDILGPTIREFDIVAIQEIRDSSETAIYELLEKVNETGREYGVVVGPRVGRSSSKEQYAFMYDTEVITFLPGEYTYDDDGDGNGVNDVDDSNHDDEFEREPFLAHFEVIDGGFDFVLVNIHTKPEEADVEIPLLTDVFEDASSVLGEADVIVLGDYNSDGRYYDEELILEDFPGDDYLSFIPNAFDTMETSDNTYDRIIGTPSLLEDFAGVVGVYRFDVIYEYQALSIEPEDVSDHYPVWVTFYTEEDTD